MAFQDFISGKVSEKAAIEAALLRVVAELQAANSAAPAVDSVVGRIQELMVILKSSPSAVVNAAKEAIRESCGDISMLVAQPREVVTLTVPRFIDEPGISPVLADVIGETSTDSSVTVEVSNTTTANEILPSSLTTTDNSDNGATEEINKPKRRTQPGFDRKVKEWGKIFDNLNADNYESGIAQIDDEYKFWNNGGKFADAEIEERLEGAIAYWTSQTTTEVTEEKTEEKTDKLLNFLLTSLGENSIVIEPDTEDLSSFDVDSNDELVETPVQHYTQSFLDKLNANNLSESGLGDLQEEITAFYGGKDNIPQELVEALTLAWGKLEGYADSEDEDADGLEYFDSNDGAETHEPTQIEETTTKDDVVLEVAMNGDIYDGDIPEDEELDDDLTEDEAADIVYADEDDQELEPIDKIENDQVTKEDIDRQIKILSDNSTWQSNILNNCETLEDLADWDRFLSNAIKKDNESVTPETLEALDSVREKLETRDTEQTKTIDKDALIADWANRAELAFDLDELATIWTEIRESGTIPSMLLVKVLDNAKARLTQVEKPTEIAPEPTFTEEEQIARESISNQWQPIAVETPVIETTPVPVEIPTPEPSTPVKTGKPNPFAGRKVEIKKDVAEEATVISEGLSDHVSISKINTSGVFDFRTLEGKIEQHKRFDDRYILEPGIKLYEPSTSFVFEIVTWEEAKALSPLMSEDANKLSLKSLHSPARSYSKAVDKTDAFVVVDDQQAHDLVAKYRAKLSQMDADAAIPMQVGS